MISRKALVRAGLEKMYASGYGSSGLNEILKAAGVPKGSFYHYFSSKEAFGLEVLEAYTRSFDGFFAEHFDNSANPPLTRLRTFFDASIKRLEAGGFQGGCLVGNVAQEMSDQSQSFRQKTEEIFVSWRDRLVPCLEEAQARGDLPRNLAVEPLADFIWNSWEGAMLRMKVTKSVKPLRNFVNYLFGLVLKSE